MLASLVSVMRHPSYKSRLAELLSLGSCVSFCDTKNICFQQTCTAVPHNDLFSIPSSAHGIILKCRNLDPKQVKECELKLVRFVLEPIK